LNILTSHSDPLGPSLPASVLREGLVGCDFSSAASRQAKQDAGVPKIVANFTPEKWYISGLLKMWMYAKQNQKI
jgi:hypothetical protein